MIIDAFMFFNEYDILEGRLNYLYDTVDYFVIVESNITHSGKSKPLNYLANVDRYQQYAKKILYFPLAIDSKKYNWNIKSTRTESYSPSWAVENLQRNHIAKALELFSDNDIVIISDVDEVPNKHILTTVIDNLTVEVPAITLIQDMFYYNFNQKQVTPWAGSVVTTNKSALQRKPQWFRSNRSKLPAINNGGWHMSYWGGALQIKFKIENFAHQEYNTPEFTDIDVINKRIESGVDIYDRDSNQFVTTDKNSIPTDILKIFDNRKKKTFIQIGAGAGDLDSRADYRDGFTELVKQIDSDLIDRIILVEPNPVNISLLKQCWKDYPQAEIYNIGICTRDSVDKSIVFYYAVEDGPHFQVFSMDIEHVKKHYPTGTIQSVTVDCMSLTDFIEFLNISESIDLLALDIEGIDAEVIMDTDWNSVNCRKLSFEYIHLGDKTDSVVNTLTTSGFKYAGVGVDYRGIDYLYTR